LPAGNVPGIFLLFRKSSDHDMMIPEKYELYKFSTGKLVIFYFRANFF